MRMKNVTRSDVVNVSCSSMENGDDMRYDGDVENGYEMRCDVDVETREWRGS